MTDVRRITEAAWQTTVLEAARIFGWSTYHTFDSRRSNAGWPDLALWHPTRGFMLRELKTDKGRVSTAQQKTIDALRAAGVDVSVWRPADWPRVELELREGPPRPNVDAAREKYASHLELAGRRRMSLPIGGPE